MNKKYKSSNLKNLLNLISNSNAVAVEQEKVIPMSIATLNETPRKRAILNKIRKIWN